MRAAEKSAGADDFVRALRVAPDEWVSAKIPPPDSRAPRVHDGTLVPLMPRAGAGFPQIPGVTYNSALVPKTDANGSEIAGVRLPDIAEPVATYTGGNLRADGGGGGCDANGMRIPFAATQGERLATGDPRLSIKERYPTHQAHVNAVTAAEDPLRAQRFLIEEDVQAFIAEAQASTIGN